MKVRRRRKRGIDIADSGALSDLAFLLIIFFIVIAVFNVNLGFILGLPRPDSTRVVNTEDLVRATLSPAGGLRTGGTGAGGTEVTTDRLEEILRERRAVRPNMTFLLTINPETPYQRVVDVVGVVRRTGVERFSFRMDGAPAGATTQRGRMGSGGTTGSGGAAQSGGSGGGLRPGDSRPGDSGGGSP